MAANVHYAETVRKIADLALADAVEITVLVNLIKTQNTGGINAELNKVGAGRAAMVFRNSLIARLVLLVDRAYAKPKHGDLHVQRAACLLKRQLSEFEAHWLKCRGDHRRPLIREFRDKYTAHLGEPKNIEPATYDELFGFAAATAEAMQLLALATRVAEQRIETEPDLINSPEAFWSPWKA